MQAPKIQKFYNSPGILTYGKHPRVFAVLILVSMCAIILYCKPKWWNWQTRRTQNPVYASTCGFKSHLRHQGFAGFTQVLFLLLNCYARILYISDYFSKHIYICKQIQTIGFVSFCIKTPIYWDDIHSVLLIINNQVTFPMLC